MGVFNREKQELDLARTQVMVSGEQTAPTRFIAAAVPELLVYRNQLYLYWSALTVDADRFSGIVVRGAELEVPADAPWSIKGASSAVTHVRDATTTEVWSVVPSDLTRNTTADLRAVWSASAGIVASASVGGTSCTAPGDDAPGCFRYQAVTLQNPLNPHAFNEGHEVTGDILPSNAQEYTRPVQDPSGNYWLLGHYLRPRSDGISDRQPMPNAAFWQNSKQHSVLVLYALRDKTLWPNSSP
jgi:hypothetical protein